MKLFACYRDEQTSTASKFYLTLTNAWLVDKQEHQLASDVLLSWVAFTGAWRPMRLMC